MNKLVYPLRYFGSYPGAKVSARKEIWLDENNYHLKYLCKECGFRFHLVIPLILIEQTAFPATPVAMINPDEQKCDHIFSRHDWNKQPLVFYKYQVMGDIGTIRERATN